jgi:hypothetical protein
MPASPAIASSRPRPWHADSNARAITARSRSRPMNTAAFDASLVAEGAAAGGGAMPESCVRSRPASAEATAAAVGRRVGSLSSNPSTRSSKAAGRSDLTLDGGAASSCASAMTVAGKVAA